MKKKFFLFFLFFVVICGICMSACKNAKVNQSKSQELVVDSSWEMVCHPSVDDLQILFYSFYNKSKDSLIIIDGGTIGNTQQVRDFINQHGGRVDAWIITHYHRDHAEVFNEIYANPEDITICQIYDSYIEQAAYHEIAQEWDDIDTFDRYYELTQKASNVHHISRGETIDINGLNFKFFSCCDDGFLQKPYGDLPNNAGLVFKVSGEKDSILFCSDFHAPNMSFDLIDEYSDELCSEYIQLSHHGNSDNDYAFYDYVNPQVAIFDAPKWLMDGENYKANELKTYLDGKGVNTYSFENIPKFFEFK